MTKWLSSVRGGRLIVLGALVALALAATAAAYFSSTGTGTASAATSALAAPTGLAGTPGAGTVSLSWHAVTPPASGPVTYYVTRNGGTPGGNCPASTAPASGTNCTDSGLSPGTYHYTVTARWRSWSATSATVNVTVTTGAATKIVLSGSTANLVSGTGRTLTATIEDASGNTVTTGPDSTATITFAQTTGAGSVSGLSNVAAVGGVATDTVTGKLAGSVTLGASGTFGGSATNSNTPVAHRRRGDRDPARPVGLDREPRFGDHPER